MARSLTPSAARRLQQLRQLARLLDNAFEVPGIRYRVGLDPILGLIPGLGDWLAPAFTLLVVLLAFQIGVPKIVQLRMVINAAVDAAVGAVPILGDLFDFGWKASSMNLALLEAHAAGARKASLWDYLFVGGIVIAVLGLILLPFIIVGWAIARLVG